MDKPTVVIDGRCGFCAEMAALGRRVLDHPGGPNPVVVPAADLDLPSLGIDPARAEHEMLWVAPDGHVRGGADAVAAWLCWQSGPLRPLGVLLRSGPVRPLAAAAYRIIARNRHRLPGGTAACRL